MTDLMQHVPVGSQNAKQASRIHVAFGVGSASSTAQELRALFVAGKVKRRSQQLRCSNNFMWLYWRDA